jgi:hypothetical protein
MPRIIVTADMLDDCCDELNNFEPIRRNTDPVSGRHDMQRRAENGGNRYRKERKLKETGR